MTPNVIVIDDDPDTRDVATEFLKLKSINVLATGNDGKEHINNTLFLENFLTGLIPIVKTCPLHTTNLIHTKTSDGKINDYCPTCQELFGEKI